MNKTCNKCGDTKSIFLFYKQKQTKDGYGCHCKECVNITQRRYTAKAMARKKLYVEYKACGKCGVEKNRSEIFKDSRTLNGLCSSCKSCKTLSKKNYHYIATNKGTNVLGWLIKTYEGTPCMDCGNVFSFCVMDFDHRPDETKDFSIGKRGTYKMTEETLIKLQKEVAKCDLVCSNCHRLRTKERRHGTIL